MTATSPRLASSSRLTRFARRLSPFLWGIYPVVYLWAVNPGQVGPTEPVRSLLVGCALAGALLVAARLVAREEHLAGIVASLGVMFVLFYGQVYESLRHVELAGLAIGRHRFLLSVWIVGGIGAVVWPSRNAGVRRSFSDLLWISAWVAVGLSGTRVAFDLWQTSASSPPQPARTSSIVPAGPEAPDIYFVILDMYTRQDVLQSTLGFDNSAFLQDLESLGFQIPDCARSNYPGTMLSFSSFLNLDYIQTFAGSLVESGAEPTALSGYIQHNRLVEELRGRGYRIVAYESGFSPTELHAADVFRSPGRSLRGLLTGGLNPFEVVYLRSTLGLFLFQGESSNLPYGLRVNLYDSPYIAHRDRMLFTLDDLPAVAAEPGPKFVFAHILAPHPPFVFDAQGEFVFRRTPFTLNQDEELLDWQTFQTGYTGEVAYLNQRLLDLARSLLAASGRESIIVFMGDHGLTRAVDSGLRFANLMAVHLPESRAQSLPRDLNAVNIFRTVLREFFGGSFPDLPNHSWMLSSPEDLSSLTEAPESGAACRPSVAKVPLGG